MAKVNLEVGATDGYGYVGVEPPLSEAQLALLGEAEGVTSLFVTKRPKKGTPYSETMVGNEESLSRQEAGEKVLKMAHAICVVLRQGGDDVSVDEEIKPIRYGVDLFNSQADREE